jgi:hypothetical protein
MSETPMSEQPERTPADRAVLQMVEAQLVTWVALPDPEQRPAVISHGLFPVDAAIEEVVFRLAVGEFTLIHLLHWFAERAAAWLADAQDPDRGDDDGGSIGAALDALAELLADEAQR